MLERLLAHVRRAVLLRECAARARHPAERELFMVVASMHEARAHKLMRQVQQVRSSKSWRRLPRLAEAMERIRA